MGINWIFINFVYNLNCDLLEKKKTQWFAFQQSKDAYNLMYFIFYTYERCCDSNRVL